MKHKELLVVSMLVFTSVAQAQDPTDQNQTLDPTDQTQTLDPANPPDTDLTEDEQKALVEGLQKLSNQPKNDLDAEEIDRLILVQLHQQALFDEEEVKRNLSLSNREFEEVMNVLDEVRAENIAIVTNQISSMCERWEQVNRLSEISDTEKSEEALNSYDVKDTAMIASLAGPQSAISRINSILDSDNKVFTEFLSVERERMQNARISTWSDTVRGTGRVKENIENHCN